MNSMISHGFTKAIDMNTKMNEKSDAVNSDGQVQRAPGKAAPFCWCRGGPMILRGTCARICNSGSDDGECGCREGSAFAEPHW